MLALKPWLAKRKASTLKKPAASWLFYFALFLFSYHAYALSIPEARHLLTRTGFDPVWSEIQPLLKLSRAEAVHQIVSQANAKPLHPIPSYLLSKPEDSLSTLLSRSPIERMMAQKDERTRLESLQGWWIEQMIQTPTPLAEQMLLFWHNHFTTSIQKVRTARLMTQQHLTLRRYALDSFDKLLSAIIHDPAMLRYLDSANNRKEQANENFARELLELFTMGPGHYSEQDIKEASRAFTGWMIQRETASFSFISTQHDDGIKTFLGQTGPWTGDDIVRIILQQPATAHFIVHKLWQFFINDTPDEKIVASIAATWQTNHYTIKPMLKQLLLTDAFWQSSNHGSMIKSPADYVVGLLRVWKIPNQTNQAWRITISQLGQDLFNPPTVKGWPGGQDWINTNTLVARQAFMQRFLHDANGMRTKKLPETWNKATEQLWQQVLLPLPPSATPDGRPAQQIEAWLLDPVFQVK